jgi:hypothetical protein
MIPNDSSASDRLWASSEYEPEEEYILEESNKLHSLRPDILNSVFDSVQICVSTAEYKAPPVDRLPLLSALEQRTGIRCTKTKDRQKRSKILIW